MKQVLQNLRNGQTDVVDVPAPGLGRNSVLIQTRASLISAGTERMLVEFGKVSLIAKGRRQLAAASKSWDEVVADLTRMLERVVLGAAAVDGDAAMRAVALPSQACWVYTFVAVVRREFACR